MPRFRQRGRAVAGALVTVSVSVVLSFVVAETAFRAVGVGKSPEPSASAGRPAPGAPTRAGFLRCQRDSLVGWIFPPFAEGRFPSDHHPTPVRSDALGLRNSTSVADDGGDVIRVLFLGDSYAFGWGVAEEEVFGRRVGEILRTRHPGIPIRTVNAGIPGYSVFQQNALLDRILQEAAIDVVVSSFSLANDPVDELRIRRFAPDRLDEYRPTILDPNALLPKLIARSRVLSWAAGRTRPLQFHVANGSGDAIRAACSSRENLAARCARENIPLLLVTIPRRTEVVGNAVMHRLSALTTRHCRGRLRRLTPAEGVRVVDVTGALSRVPRPEEAYLANDRHWTALGHQTVAEVVAREIPAEWIRQGR